MIFTQSSTTPAVAPTTQTASGANSAICSSEYFVTQAPTSQIASTISAMTAHRRRSFTSESLDTLNRMLAANYRSGDDFVVEFLGHRFEFSARDFEERVIAAAVRIQLRQHRAYLLSDHFKSSGYLEQYTPRFRAFMEETLGRRIES